MAIRLHALAHDLSWTSLRYFNAAGADPDGETGERHDPETHIIPLAILAALEGHTLNIFGSGCATRDGSAERDFVHVSDLADAHVLALNRLRDGGDSRPMNLCAGQGVTILEICDAVERELGRPLHRISAPARKGDPDRLVGDSGVAAAALEWSSARSSLPQLVRDAAAWLQNDQRRVTRLQPRALAV